MRGDGRVTFVYFGDGASSQGETHEAMNFAGVHKTSGDIHLREQRLRHIRAPADADGHLRDIANRAEGYGFPGIIVDGLDLLASYEACREAISHARREGAGAAGDEAGAADAPHYRPTMIAATRPKEEIEAVRERDPVATFGNFMLEQGYLTEEQEAEIRAQARRAVNEATDAAEAAQPPDASNLHRHVYAP